MHNTINFMERSNKVQQKKTAKKRLVVGSLSR